MIKKLIVLSFLFGILFYIASSQVLLASSHIVASNVAMDQRYKSITLPTENPSAKKPAIRSTSSEQKQQSAPYRHRGVLQDR